MAEWSKAAVLKTAVPARVPGVQIPSPPLNFRGSRDRDPPVAGTVGRPADDSADDSGQALSKFTTRSFPSEGCDLSAKIGSSPPSFASSGMARCMGSNGPRPSSSAVIAIRR